MAATVAAARQRLLVILQGYTRGCALPATVAATVARETMAVELDADRITAIYVVRNPDKLHHLT